MVGFPRRIGSWKRWRPNCWNAAMSWSKPNEVFGSYKRRFRRRSFRSFVGGFGWRPWKKKTRRMCSKCMKCRKVKYGQKLITNKSIYLSLRFPCSVVDCWRVWLLYPFWWTNQTTCTKMYKVKQRPYARTSSSESFGERRKDVTCRQLQDVINNHSLYFNWSAWKYERWFDNTTWIISHVLN